MDEMGHTLALARARAQQTLTHALSFSGGLFTHSPLGPAGSLTSSGLRLGYKYSSPTARVPSPEQLKAAPPHEAFI